MNLLASFRAISLKIITHFASFSVISICSLRVHKLFVVWQNFCFNIQFWNLYFPRRLWELGNLFLFFFFSIKRFQILPGKIVSSIVWGFPRVKVTRLKFICCFNKRAVIWLHFMFKFNYNSTHCPGCVMWVTFRNSSEFCSFISSARWYKG